MIFYVGEFKRNDSSDYDIHEYTTMCDALGEQLIQDLLNYSSKAWKTYGDTNSFGPTGYLVVKVYGEFENAARATWFQLKYPQVQISEAQFNEL